MMKKVYFAVFLSCIIQFLFISTFLFAQTAPDADSAIKRLEAAIPASAAPTAQVTRGKAQPKWVNDP